MHGRPRLTGVVAAGLGLVLVVALATAFAWWRGRPVDVAVPDGGADPVCAQAARALPATVRDRPRTPTTADSAAVAAWGRDGVIWRCGVADPGPTTDECVGVDGVDWVRRPLRDGSAFTAYGRSPAVEVLVPRVAGHPEPLVLPDFSAVVRGLPQTRECTQ
ncbi:hypothetical protein GCM10025868_40250 [Angustibacter aerolatus]|uniref:DUF3515 domain-containing protein n=1 Tax=Angustibacter aerolatus TaxID=1162965 RepID=A0ABQ6JNE5_9ACTN|nr:hypothetical protein GCM10025868_40250 [Angustibacter aerolatus]